VLKAYTYLAGKHNYLLGRYAAIVDST